MFTYSDVSPRFRAQQRGDILLEALFGVLITALIAVPFVHIQNKILNSQHQVKVERMIVAQLSDQLERSGVDLCNTTSNTPTATAKKLQLSANLVVDRNVVCGGEAKVSVGIVNGTDSLKHDISLPPQVSLIVPGASIDTDRANPGPDLKMSTQQ